MKILLVEDDQKMAEYVVAGLRQLGHSVDLAPDGRDGLHLAGCGQYDAIVVDRMMPNLDGLGMVKIIRSAGIKTPLLFLTALGEVHDRVEGLDAGADDYLTKPFAFSELVSRLNALSRRPAMAVIDTVLRVADLELDVGRRTVRRGSRDIVLQPTEFQLLEHLMRRSGQVLTRTMLLEGVWDINFDPKTNVVDVHISRLRRKIEAKNEKPLIHTIRGIGYVLRAAD